MVLSSFVAAVFFALITPGPGVMSTAGIGANYGLRAGLWFVAGLYCGNSAVYIAVAMGMLAVLESMPALRLGLAVLSLLYLLYLAAKIALAGARVAFIHPHKAPGFWGGLLLQFINPKAYAVNGFFISNFSLASSGNATDEVLLKYFVINALWIPIHFVWLALGLSLHRMELAPVWQRRINIAMALAMVAVVLLAAAAV